MEIILMIQSMYKFSTEWTSTDKNCFAFVNLWLLPILFDISSFHYKTTKQQVDSAIWMLHIILDTTSLTDSVAILNGLMLNKRWWYYIIHIRYCRMLRLNFYVFFFYIFDCNMAAIKLWSCKSILHKFKWANNKA